jgi:hypothetical protein
LPQARDDPVAVRNLFAAKPENIGRASHLLFHGSPIFLRKCRRLNRDAAAGHYRKAHSNLICPHVQSFLRINSARMLFVRPIHLKL